MKIWLERLFPRQIDNRYFGYRVAMFVFFALTAISFGRSVVHVFSFDGGANSIAGLDLTEGSANIIFSFALWGSSQLILALLQILVCVRYRKLIPFMYLMLFVETLLRMLVGAMKEPVIDGIPPGGYANYVMIPLTLIMLWLSLRSPNKVDRPNVST
ncbi:MAG: hypothetical protein MZU97_05290 [Bacillus subtilis]|nr:hypothetical protein [Bacillus subtilis]